MPSPGLREKQAYSLLSRTIVSMKNTTLRSLLQSLYQYTSRHNCVVSQVRVGHEIFWTLSLGISREDIVFFTLSSEYQLLLDALAFEGTSTCKINRPFSDILLSCAGSPTLRKDNLMLCNHAKYICSNKIQGKPMHVSAPLPSTPDFYHLVWNQKETVKY